MLVVDAGALFEVVAATPDSGALVERLAEEPEQFAPHLIDVEVFSVIRRQHAAGRLDDTAARQAVADLQDWPGERVGHRLFLERPGSCGTTSEAPVRCTSRWRRRWMRSC